MSFTRREFLGHVGSAVAVGAVAGDSTSAAESSSGTVELCFSSGLELARLIRERKLSAREVMSAHLGQIARLNPKINAIVAKLDDDKCLALAEEADRKFL